MKYRGIHRRIGKIDWSLNRPIIQFELHAGAYIFALFIIMLTAGK